MKKGGWGRGIAQLSGALLMVLYCWIPLKEFFNLGKISNRGVLGVAKFLEQFSGNFDHFRLFKSHRINFSV